MNHNHILATLHTRIMRGSVAMKTGDQVILHWLLKRSSQRIFIASKNGDNFSNADFALLGKLRDLI